jgi:hypothetical protein
VCSLVQNKEQLSLEWFLVRRYHEVLTDSSSSRLQQASFPWMNGIECSLALKCIFPVLLVHLLWLRDRACFAAGAKCRIHHLAQIPRRYWSLAAEPQLGHPQMDCHRLCVGHLLEAARRWGCTVVIRWQVWSTEGTTVRIEWSKNATFQILYSKTFLQSLQHKNSSLPVYGILFQQRWSFVPRISTTHRIWKKSSDPNRQLTACS